MSSGWMAAALGLGLFLLALATEARPVRINDSQFVQSTIMGTFVCHVREATSPRCERVKMINP